MITKVIKDGEIIKEFEGAKNTDEANKFFDMLLEDKVEVESFNVVFTNGCSLNDLNELLSGNGKPSQVFRQTLTLK